MYCAGCGRDIGNAKFCPNCGAPAQGCTPAGTLTIRKADLNTLVGAGIDVYVDGRFETSLDGKNRVDLNLPVGSHKVRLQIDGFPDATADIFINPNSTTSYVLAVNENIRSALLTKWDDPHTESPVPDTARFAPNAAQPASNAGQPQPFPNAAQPAPNAGRHASHTASTISCTYQNCNRPIHRSACFSDRTARSCSAGSRIRKRAAIRRHNLFKMRQQQCEHTGHSGKPRRNYYHSYKRDYDGKRTWMPLVAPDWLVVEDYRPVFVAVIVPLQVCCLVFRQRAFPQKA